MEFNINKSALSATLLTLVLTSAFFVFGLPRLQRAREPACHDSIHVFPLTEDEEVHTDIPARKLKFACPHPDQKLEFIGHGGFTCKCDAYSRSK